MEGPLNCAPIVGCACMFDVGIVCKRLLLLNVYRNGGRTECSVARITCD